MKLLVISHEYPPIGGGGANACYFLTREFARQGNDVTIITAQFENLPAEEQTEDQVNIQRVKCKRHNKEKSSFYEMFTFLCGAWRLSDRLCRQNHYDRCLVFFGIPSGPVALHLKKKYKLPYIVRFGGGDIPGAQKRFKYVYKVLKPMIRKICREADALVANSEGLKNRALRFENKYDVDIIENGVDQEFFTPIEKDNNAEMIQILFVSRLIEGKGLQFVIPYMAEINRQIQEKCNCTVHLQIVGDGPYREELEKITQASGAESLVSFEGRKDKEQVKKYDQEADIFILPSLSEGMPNVVLEAMACGLPIVMTPCEGSKELIHDNGIISTIEEFPVHLAEICSNKNLREQMGKNSLKLVKQNFRWKSISERYLELLKNSGE